MFENQTKQNIPSVEAKELSPDTKEMLDKMRRKEPLRAAFLETSLTMKNVKDESFSSKTAEELLQSEDMLHIIKSIGANSEGLIHISKEEDGSLKVSFVRPRE